jgi:predicted kinase
MRTLIVLSAIPGSGKSTWAKKYQKEHANTFIVSSDEIRLEFFGAVNDFRDERRVWDTFLERLNHYAETMADVTVIADATNLQNKYRRMYAELTPKYREAHPCPLRHPLRHLSLAESDAGKGTDRPGGRDEAPPR